MALIKQKKSIIPSCDVDTLEKLSDLVKATCNVKGIGGYKIGFEIVLPFGMQKVVHVIRKHTDLPIIYDHQKSGTDIPDMGKKFMAACQYADSVIIFPQAGPETEKAWITAAKDAKMHLIVGGEMTHAGYLKETGGFLDNDAPSKIYQIAAEMGISDFVIPGNKTDKCIKYNELIKKKIKNPVYYSPGLVTQGGNISEVAKKLDSWHAIIGRAIYEAEDMEKAAEEYASQLV
jgi:orotidine-5'-phosphate decarboxylase